MLFNRYMRLLGEVIMRFGLFCHLYVNDTQLYLTLPSDPKDAVKSLNQRLEVILTECGYKK